MVDVQYSATLQYLYITHTHPRVRNRTVNTLMLYKNVILLIPRLHTHFCFSLFPTVSTCSFLSVALPLLFLSDSTHRFLLSLSPSISVCLWFPHLSCSCVMGDHSLAVCGENVVDPGHQRADFGVNAWVVRLSAALSPRDNTLQLPITHQRTTRVALSGKEKEQEKRVYSFYHLITQYLSTAHVDPLIASSLNKRVVWLIGIYLTRIFAALQVSSAHHAVSDHTRVGSAAFLVG